MSTFSILPGDELNAERYPPAALLQAHVECYWRLSVAHPPAVVRVVPDGLIDLVFDLRQQQVFVAGSREQPATFTHKEPTELLGVSLRPGTAMSLLGVSAGTLLQSWQPLAEVIGEVATGLGALVFAAGATRDQLAIIDAFLLARLCSTIAEPRIQQALDQIIRSDGAIDVETLGRLTGASPRNLGRMFDEWVGMPPKRFARIVRLQAAMRRLADEPQLELTRLALEAGYADHAHLTREMQALAGTSPSDLARTLSDSFKK